MDNLLIGILLMTIGSFAGSSYYAPINKIKNWSWETYWICQGIVSWIILPWAFTLYAVPFSALGTVLTAAPAKSMFLAVLFGALWGIGGLTWGLSMRYLRRIRYGDSADRGRAEPLYHSRRLGDVGRCGYLAGWYRGNRLCRIAA